MIKKNKVVPKEMIYTNKGNRELLFNDIYNGYHYYIISMGTHPCAYVEISKKDIDINKIRDEINTHGGVTYCEKGLSLSHGVLLKGNWFIGWDYAHLGDYLGFLMHEPELLEDCKKWKTKEIVEDCKSVIDQLIEME